MRYTEDRKLSRWIVTFIHTDSGIEVGKVEVTGYNKMDAKDAAKKITGIPLGGIYHSRQEWIGYAK